MRPYLSEYFNTLSRRRSEKVSALLEEARVGKEQLNAVMERLQDGVGNLENLTLAEDRENLRISSGPITQNLRDMSLRLRDLFGISNLVATLLQSHASVLTSDIKAIEDQLIAMEKMAANSAFLLSDNQAYDFAYLESFSDELNRDLSLTRFSDRSGNDFDQNQQAHVRVDEGVLTLPQTIQNSHGMVATILKSNVSAVTVSDTGIKNALKIGTSTGWSMKVASATPVTSSMPEAGGITGAQVLLEFRLTQPAPSSEIKLIPYANMPVEVLQVITYKKDNDPQGEELLDAPRKLDRPLTLHFPIQSVAKFTVLLNQSVFQREDRREKESEVFYARDVRQINTERQDVHFDVRRSFHIRKLERAIQSGVLSEEFDFFSTSLPSTDLRPDRGPLNPVLLRLNRNHGRGETWQETMSKKSRIVDEVLRQRKTAFDQITRGKASVEMSALSNPLAHEEDVVSHVVTGFNPQQETNFNFYYSLGLNYIGIGVDSPRYKGVFVSKPLPSIGDIGEIRMKASVDNYSIPVTDRFSNVVTSAEFSVSNRSDPSSEDDWIPILPIGTDRVVGERLLPDQHGFARFRFSAQAGQVFTVYRNGYLMNNFQEAQGFPGEIIGIKIDPTLFGPEDVFTCDYYPMGDQSTVSFSPYGFDELPLVSAFDSSGAGERYIATEDRNTVTLNNYPYIDPVESKSVLYTPITVVVDDGTVPINLTDYRTRKSVSLPADDYYYIHSGNTLMFNQAITQPFRVYYQYLQNNVRFRVVLRCNVRDFVSPRVDYVHVKAKTRRPDVTRL